MEKNPACRRVVESHYPGVITVLDVEQVDAAMVRQWSLMFSQAELVILGGGPPCQGVSGLNADRKGALVDPRSCLFKHMNRVRGLLQQSFSWCPVHGPPG